MRFTLLIVPIKQVAPVPPGVTEGEWMEPLPWSPSVCVLQGDQIRHPLAFVGGGIGCLSSILPSLPLLPGSLRPVQVTVFGFIFCWARLSPGRGGGRERRRGGGTAISAQSQSLCSCPPWPGCHPLLEGPVPGDSGDLDPCGTSSPGAGQQVQNRPSSPCPSSIHPATEHQREKGL